MPGFGTLLGANSAPEALDLPQLFMPAAMFPTIKAPLLSAEASNPEQTVAADSTLQEGLVDPSLVAFQSVKTEGADVSLFVESRDNPLQQGAQFLSADGQAGVEGDESLTVNAWAVPLVSLPNTASPLGGIAPNPVSPGPAEAEAIEPFLTIAANAKTIAPVPSAATIVDALPVSGAPVVAIGASKDAHPDGVVGATAISNIGGQSPISVVAPLLRPAVPPSPAGAQLTVPTKVVAATTVPIADAATEIASVEGVLVRAITTPVEALQLVTAATGVVNKAVPKQSVEIGNVADEEIIAGPVNKTGFAFTVAETITPKPQAQLEWYTRVASDDGFRAANEHTSLPTQAGLSPSASAQDAKAAEISASGKHRFAEAITSQIKSVDVTQERTHIALNPRGLGNIDIEISQSADNTLKVTIRAENPVVLQALRDERNLLAQAIGFDSGASLEFHQQTQDEQARTANNGGFDNPELHAGEATGELNSKETVEVIARNQLDITT